ncbi:tRNA pseudouridine(55) synthase TruB [Salisediminibacterium halotolerans]|uniref:tRNA pseudouridine synthase B n=1 Tax=Salisediminibacterium halotolerans TaxID=517425 RepID=A0A1H9QAL9_9BACI|nr:tRNA pseudouridine(55) synthase TruB [Salisediminibacterium haloalkalitolerans]SER56909.1 tRNA pseudouridine55 synthase [Salisediminibacterium haloalkalitolerans]
MDQQKTGIVPLWKPRGMTSFQAVKEVGRLLGTKKAGHTGTLDPEVDGVLPICIGRATKLVEYLTAEEKVYHGEVTIGFSTTTEDQTGEKVAEAVPEELFNSADLEHVFTSLTGAITQTPPMYSAVKVKGKRLYEYARNGETVERPSRQVTIYSLTLLNAPRRNTDGTVSLSFRARCSKGTYIRTLAVSIGEKLGFPAHMSKLTREASGFFAADMCLTLDQLKQSVLSDRLDECLISVEEALKMYPAVTVSEKDAGKVLQGAILPLPEGISFEDDPFLAVFSPNGTCLALYKQDDKRAGKMKPEKMIRTVDHPG